MSGDQLSRGVPDQWLPENQDEDVKHFVDQTTGEKVSFDDFYGDNEQSDGGSTRTSKVSRKATQAPKKEASSSDSPKGAGE